jgi:hypothetical protein
VARITFQRTCRKGDADMSTSNPQNALEEQAPVPADVISKNLLRDFVRMCVVLLALISLSALAMWWIFGD